MELNDKLAAFCLNECKDRNLFIKGMFVLMEEALLDANPRYSLSKLYEKDRFNAFRIAAVVSSPKCGPRGLSKLFSFANVCKNDLKAISIMVELLGRQGGRDSEHWRDFVHDLGEVFEEANPDLSKCSQEEMFNSYLTLDTWIVPELNKLKSELRPLITTSDTYFVADNPLLIYAAIRFFEKHPQGNDVFRRCGILSFLSDMSFCGDWMSNLEFQGVKSDQCEARANALKLLRKEAPKLNDMPKIFFAFDMEWCVEAFLELILYSKIPKLKILEALDGRLVYCNGSEFSLSKVKMILQECKAEAEKDAMMKELFLGVVLEAVGGHKSFDVSAKLDNVRKKENEDFIEFLLSNFKADDLEVGALREKFSKFFKLIVQYSVKNPDNIGKLKALTKEFAGYVDYTFIEKLSRIKEFHNFGRMLVKIILSKFMEDERNINSFNEVFLICKNAELHKGIFQGIWKEKYNVDKIQTEKETNYSNNLWSLKEALK